MKHLFFSCRLLCSLLLSTFLFLGASPMWGEDTPTVAIEFKNWTKAPSSPYSSTEFTDLGCSFTYCNNNWSKNSSWAYIRLGGKGGSSATSTTTATSYIKYNSAVSKAINKVVLSHNGISNNSVTINYIELEVYSDKTFTTKIASEQKTSLSISKSTAGKIEFTTDASWPKDSYYKVNINWKIKGTSNYGFDATKLEFYEATTPVIPSHNVAFNLQGHGSAIDKQTVEEGATISEPTTPEETGYIFGGWYKESSCTSKWNFTTDVMGTNDIILYAKWTPKTYEISLDKNDHGTEDGSAIVDYDAAIEDGYYSAVSYDNTAWNLLGYFTTATDGVRVIDEDGVLVANVDGYTQNGKWIHDGDVTLYAQFESAAIVRYDVKLIQPDHATIDANMTSAKENDEITLSYRDVAEHYHFVSWSVVDAESSPIDVADNKFRMPASDVTVSATFEEDTKYVVNIATPTNGSISVKDGEVTLYDGAEVYAGATLTLSAIADDGYAFERWVITGSQPASETEASTTLVVSAATSINASFVEHNYGIEAYRLNLVQCGTDAQGKDTTSTDRPSVYPDVVKAVFACNQDIVNTVSSTRVYAGRQPMGAKFGSSDRKGTLVITLASATDIQSIVFNAAMYGATSSETNADKGFTVKLNDETSGESFSLSAGNKVFEDVTLYVGGKSISKITIEQNEANKGRFYLHHIAICTAQTIISVSAAKYATYYNASSAFTMPEGLEGITVEGVSGNTLTLETRYEAGEVVPAGEALLLHGEEGAYNLIATTTKNAKIDDNLLKGTSNFDELTTGGAPYYRLSQHEGKVGFYYGAENGAAFKPGANKAYLALNGVSAPARFIFGQQGVPTDLLNVNDNNQSTKVLRDGRLYIIREGKTYDSLGRLVK